MKKIIFFSKNLNMGGMEKALINLLNRLVNDYDTTLVLEEKEGILLEKLDKRIKVLEYRTNSSKIILIRKIINFSKRLIWSIQNKNKYDFSCSYATYSIIGAKLAIISSNNSTLYVHSNYYDYFNGNKMEIQNFFNNLNVNKFKKLIFVSNESKDLMASVLQNQKDKMIVINNLIDYKNILFNSKEKCDFSKFDNSTINVLFVGRLDNTSKNFDLLIKSFSYLDNGYKLFIIGDGYYKKELINKIKEYKLKNVVLLGEKVNPYPYISKCDALILTSKYEGFPVIYMEALVLNKKFITTVSVSDDLIDIKKYFSVVKAKPEVIADEIRKINKNTVQYNLDYEKINDYNYSILLKTIEGE